MPYRGMGSGACRMHNDGGGRRRSISRRGRSLLVVIPIDFCTASTRVQSHGARPDAARRNEEFRLPASGLHAAPEGHHQTTAGAQNLVQRLTARPPSAACRRPPPSRRRSPPPPQWNIERGYQLAGIIEELRRIDADIISLVGGQDAQRGCRHWRRASSTCCPCRVHSGTRLRLPASAMQQEVDVGCERSGGTDTGAQERCQPVPRFSCHCRR